MPDHVPQAHGEPGARAELDRLVKRLRLLSPRSWRVHRVAVQETLNQLVALAAAQERRDFAVPDVADHVLPDAIAVIGSDLLDALSSDQDAPALAEIERVIKEALRATR